MVKSSQNILLESGTNEVEIIEFYLGGQSFGVNVAKVKQIVQFSKSLLTEVPNAHHFSMGTFLFRGQTIPIIDLKKAMDMTVSEESAKPLVLVTEFNELINGFYIDGVNRIHRISWSDLQPLNTVLEGYSTCFTGSVSVDNNEILIVDLEQIIAEINPEITIKSDAQDNDKESVQEINVILAEDSTFIRNSMVKQLTIAGYHIVKAFDNGKDACDYIFELGEKGKLSEIDVVISDIEMPQMDGLTLCRNIKTNDALKSTNVVLFSSLINEQMVAKCKSVGADSYIAKPRISDLVGIIDKILK